MDWRVLGRGEGMWRRGAKARLITGISIIGTLIWCSAATAQELPDVRSSHDGVYTTEQAEGGAELFQATCSNCHNGSYPLHGTDFLRLWAGQPLWRLYEYLFWNMPYGAAGSLTSEQYLALTAYILEMNGYPAGDEPLPDDQLGLAFINLDPH